LKRFEEKVSKELKNESLNFFVPYEILNEIEKPHFLQDQKISAKAILEVNEMEKITKEQRHLYIFDAIEQLIKNDIDRLAKERRQKLEKNNSKAQEKEVKEVKKQTSTTLQTE
jgi:molecular chaperone DnaK (HSP70)